MRLSRRPRDSGEGFFLYTAAAILAGSLACAGLVAAVFLGALDGSLAGAIAAAMAAAFGIYFGYRLYRLAEAAAVGEAGPRGTDDPAAFSNAAQVVPLPTIDVAVSRWARRLIAGQGGRAFVWVDDVGRSYSLLKAATRDPGRHEFRRHRVDGLEMFVAKDVDVPKVTLRASRLFPWRLVAEWPGAVLTPGA
jgi:hypothetical protein